MRMIHALNNLINDSNYATVINEHRAAMRKFMQDSSDPMLEVFDQRNDAAAVSAYVDKVQAESDERRKNKRKKQPARARKKQNAKLFELKLPHQANSGSEFTVTIDHRLPDKLGEQKFHVTLKNESGKRIERKVLSAKGKGELTVTFELPSDNSSKSVSVSAFVGEDYSSNLLHKTIGPVEVSK